jgi:hypothetical protein
MSNSIFLEPPIRKLIRSTLSHRSHAFAANPLNKQDSILPPTLLPALRNIYKEVQMRPVLSLYASDIFSATRHHPELDGTLLTAQARKDLDSLAQAERIVTCDLTGMELLSHLAALRAQSRGERGRTNRRYILDLTKADIGRIAPRIMSHRLRVRDGPADEILGSVAFGAVLGDKGEVKWERRTIKDILIKILREV